MSKRPLLKKLAILTTSLIGIGALGMGGVLMYYSKDLPDVAELRDYAFLQNLEVYDRNGELIADYGLERRTLLKYSEFPEKLKQAIIAIEDHRFFEHSGVDFIGTGRAFVNLVVTGDKSQGGSTITQQVARNFFLSNKKEYSRKIKEIILALKMENQLSKEEILELYMNKVFLGERSYGFAQAALTYFGKEISDPTLSLAQIALLAGLPQSPSVTNPIASVERATARRNQVLKAMLENRYITQQDYDLAVNEPVVVRTAENQSLINYISEYVRLEVIEKYGEEAAYNRGFRVYTTIDNQLQAEAMAAVRRNLFAYDQRHGYRGAAGQVFTPGNYPGDEAVVQELRLYPTFEPIYPVVIKSVNDQVAVAINADGNELQLNLASVAWARKHIDNDHLGATPTKVSSVLHEGDLVYVQSYLVGENQIVHKLSQIPAVNSGLISIDSTTGAIEAMVGGFSYAMSTFNRATQAAVQVGSTIKPFIYSFALEQGKSLGDSIEDAPVAYKLDGGEIWQPQNYGESYGGKMTLRQALAQSRNSVAVKLMLDHKGGYVEVANYLQRFGFAAGSYPVLPALSLGAANFTPLQMARAYAVFANGGFLVKPYIITRIEAKDGEVLTEDHPIACDAESDIATPNVAKMPNFNPDVANGKCAPRVLDREVAWLMNDALNSNIFGRPGYSGTGAKAQALGRTDIGGKTGTSNSSRSAWFVGYAGKNTTAVFVAFDKEIDLGKGETGGKTALPAWIDFERAQLEGEPAFNLKTPTTLVETRIDPISGCLDASGVREYFVKNKVPTCRATYTREVQVEVEVPVSGSKQEAPASAPTAPVNGGADPEQSEGGEE